LPAATFDLEWEILGEDGQWRPRPSHSLSVLGQNVHVERSKCRAKAKIEVMESTFSFLRISMQPALLDGTDCFLTHTWVYKIHTHNFILHLSQLKKTEGSTYLWKMEYLESTSIATASLKKDARKKH
jgi:hypothetical protein